MFPSSKKYKPLSKFPTARFDLSVIAPARELVGTIGSKIKASGVPEIVAIEYVKQYSGAPLAEGTKSVTFCVTVGATDHTLSGDEIAALRACVIKALVDAGYEFRA